MFDFLSNWITKGELSGYSSEELATHTRYMHYYAAGIAVCVALLWVQYGEIRKQDMK
ncbi:hypothetical protein BH09BAC4_BH09BAC4_44140 [soil metagenome]